MFETVSTAFDIKKLILAGILTKSALFGRGGIGDFGGGDIVRAEFLNRGAAIILYLEEAPEGQRFAAENKLNLENLKSSLDVEKILVTDEVLVDRTGSVVDAVGAPGLIVLNRTRWMEHSERDSDVYFMVLHELLRENGINDDNYVISKSLIPFPEKYRLQNILITEKPLIASDRLDHLVDRSQIALGGTGCPKDSFKTFTRFNPTLNEVEIYPNEMTVASGQNAAQNAVQRKNCALRIPFKAAANKRLQITQVDVSGEVEMQPSKSMNVNFTTGFVSGNSKPVTQIPKQILSGKEIVDGGFLIRDNKLYESGCGQSAMLTLNSDLVLKNLKSAVSEKTSVARVNKLRISIKLVDCKI